MIEKKKFDSQAQCICYTIGYGNRTFEDFIYILYYNKITHLIDIRHYPNSWQEIFDKENLKEILPKYGISYAHCSGVGGIREGMYTEYMGTEQFNNSFVQLIAYIKEVYASYGNVVLMCAEKNPKECHRLYLARHLEESTEIKVIHLTEAGQMNLFNFL